MAIATPTVHEGGPHRRVLLVEDNATLRALLSLALETHGYVPLTAETCEAALELAAVDPPDAWVVDHTMPGMSGAELVRRLRSSSDARLRDAPVLGVSGRDENACELRRAGAWQTLQKPVDERRLLAWLNGGGD
ncbi:MAG TPA: response regulator [Anaeromyxobacteraceae bacterium]|nr:response regulator [Anaeromyxobacteraceae bacterium]